MQWDYLSFSKECRLRIVKVDNSYHRYNNQKGNLQFSSITHELHIGVECLVDVYLRRHPDPGRDDRYERWLKGAIIVWR